MGAVVTSAARKQASGTVKAKRRSEAAERLSIDLSPGDTIGFSMSVSVRTKRGSEAWVKGEATTTIRGTETASAAKDRLFRAVEAMVDEAARGI